jgi:hypothetical protein
VCCMYQKSLKLRLISALVGADQKFAHLSVQQNGLSRTTQPVLHLFHQWETGSVRVSRTMLFNEGPLNGQINGHQNKLPLDALRRLNAATRIILLCRGPHGGNEFGIGFDRFGIEAARHAAALPDNSSYFLPFFPQTNLTVKGHSIYPLHVPEFVPIIVTISHPSPPTPNLPLPAPCLQLSEMPMDYRPVLSAIR